MHNLENNEYLVAKNGETYAILSGNKRSDQGGGGGMSNLEKRVGHLEESVNDIRLHTTELKTAMPYVREMLSNLTSQLENTATKNELHLTNESIKDIKEQLKATASEKELTSFRNETRIAITAPPKWFATK